MAAQPQGNEDVPAQEEVRHMYAPEQISLDDDEGGRRIHICRYDIHGKEGVSAEKSYRRLMRKVKRRQRRISPMVIGPNEIPLTPLPNPVTGPSFKIIQIRDDWEPDYAVDLMIRDTNSYVVAFRRQKRNDEGVWIKGTWYRYRNERLPSWIHGSSVDLGFESSHGDTSETKPGGIFTIHEMFMVLAKFQDCRRRNGKLIDGKDRVRVEKALYIAIIMFAEATRFRSILNAIALRIRRGEEPSELDEFSWHLIKNWEHVSKEVVNLCEGGLPAMDNQAPAYFRVIQIRDLNTGEIRNLETVDDVIGNQGEFTLLLGKPEFIGTKKELEELAKQYSKPTAVSIPDPGFPSEDEDEDGDEDEDEDGDEDI